MYDSEDFMTERRAAKLNRQQDFVDDVAGVRRTSRVVMTGAVILCLLGGLFLLGAIVLLAARLTGRGPANVDSFTVLFDLVVGSVFLSLGIFLARVARRKSIDVQTAKKLVLRNDRQHHGAALLASCLFAVVGIACFCGLIAANIRDPKALWAGPEVKFPRAVYLFLEGLAFVWGLAMGAFAVFSARRFADRSIQLVIDETGLYDHRAKGQLIVWSQIADVKLAIQKQKGTVIVAALNLVMKNGSTQVIDVFGLDMDYNAILDLTTKMRSMHRL